MHFGFSQSVVSFSILILLYFHQIERSTNAETAPLNVVFNCFLGQGGARSGCKTLRAILVIQ